MLKTRTYLFLGFGDNWANESKVFLSGANYEQRMNLNIQEQMELFPLI